MGFVVIIPKAFYADQNEWHFILVLDMDSMQATNFSHSFASSKCSIFLSQTSTLQTTVTNVTVNLQLTSGTAQLLSVVCEKDPQHEVNPEPQKIKRKEDI